MLDVRIVLENMPLHVYFINVICNEPNVNNEVNVDNTMKIPTTLK